MNKEKPNYDAFELAYAKGKIKEWTLERLIIDTLYKTKESDVSYIKIVDINCFGEPDETDDTGRYLIYKYGYLFQNPKTEIDLIIDSALGKMMLRRVGPGWGYDNVEKTIYNDIKKQIKNKNIYFMTNFDEEEFLIK